MAHTKAIQIHMSKIIMDKKIYILSIWIPPAPKL